MLMLRLMLILRWVLILMLMLRWVFRLRLMLISRWLDQQGPVAPKQLAKAGMTEEDWVATVSR